MPAALDLILRSGARPVPTLAGPLLWYDVSRLKGYGDGAAVGVVPDLSGNGYDAGQVTAAARPLYKTGVLNGLPTLRFDGSNDVLTTASITLAGLGMAMFAVLKQRASQAGNIRAIGWNGASPAKIQLEANHANINSYYVSLQGGAAAMAQDTFGVVTHYYDTVRIYGYVNGTNLTNNAQAGTPTAGACTVGGGAGTFLDGDVVEMLVYDRLLTTAERQLVERALGAKYGITVA